MGEMLSRRGTASQGTRRSQTKAVGHGSVVSIRINGRTLLSLALPGWGGSSGLWPKLPPDNSPATQGGLLSAWSMYGQVQRLET